MTQTLHDFIGKLERVGGESFIAEVRRQVATDGLRLIAAGYRDSKDPYGAAWTPLKYRNGKPLVLTGAFRDTWMAYPTPTGVRFLSGVDYGAYHQYGTSKIPFRRVIPLQSMGLPKPWTDVINAAYTKRVRQAVA
jgi:phage gpG-like protein